MILKNPNDLVRLIKSDTNLLNREIASVAHVYRCTVSNWLLNHETINVRHFQTLLNAYGYKIAIDGREVDFNNIHEWLAEEVNLCDMTLKEFACEIEVDKNIIYKSNISWETFDKIIEYFGYDVEIISPSKSIGLDA